MAIFVTPIVVKARRQYSSVGMLFTNRISWLVRWDFDLRDGMVMECVWKDFAAQGIDKALIHGRLTFSHALATWALEANIRKQKNYF